VLHATATLTDSEVGETRTSHLEVATTLTGSRLEIAAAGDFTGVTAATTGWASSPPMNLNGTANVRLALYDFHGPFTVDSIDLSGQVSLGPSTVRDQAITSAVIDGDLLGGLATIRALTVEAPDTHVSASGVMALGPEGDSALKLTASSDDLARIGALAGVPLAGTADIKADVTGPASRPVARGTLNGRQLAYGTKASALALDSDFTVEVPDWDLTRVKGDATSEGTFIKAAGFDLVRMTLKAGLDGRELTLDTRLEETVRIVEIGGVVNFEPDGRTVALRHAEITAGQTTWALPQGEQARLRIGTDRIRVENLSFVRDAQRIDVTGGLALAPEAQAGEELTIQAHGVQIEDINSLLLSQRSFNGVVEGTVTVRGSAKAPDATGDITILNPQVNQVKFEQARGHVEYTNAVAKVDAELVQTTTNRLTVKGSVPLSGPGMDLRVTSTPVDLAFAQAFTTELTSIAGTGRFDLHVTGARNAPVVDGDVALENGSFSVDATGVRYQGLTAQLAFKGRHLDVRQFRVLDDAGHELRAEGGLDVVASDGLRSMDMKIVTNGFRILRNKFGTAEIDADLTADGDLGAPKIAGRLRVAGGRIEVDQLLQTTTKTVYSTQPLVPDEPVPADVAAAKSGSGPAPPPSPDTLFGRMDLALRLELPDDLVLRGRDLRTGGSFVSLGDMNLIAGGTLDLQKRPGGAMTAIGNLQLVRGYYSFQGKRFDIERDSQVRFQGMPSEPALNITATRTISGVDASVRVGGTIREPTVDLSSRPPLDDADLLALIVFGQPVNDLGSGERSTLAERAASMAAGVITAPVADSIARALNIDMVEIQAPTDSSAPVVALGSQVGTRLYIGVRQEIGHGDSSLVSIEYRIASALRLVTSIALGSVDRHLGNRKERSGVDLIYMVRY
jgi:translocation and assembly module TamB